MVNMKFITQLFNRPAGKKTLSTDIVSDISGILNAPSYDSSRQCRMDLKELEANRCLSIFPDSSITKYYTQLRTQITQRALTKGWKTIMITSCRPKAGKTLTAINLSLTFARTSDDKVLLVDGNLKHQQIYAYMGLPGEKGLSDAILNKTSMNEVMVWPGIDKLTVISGGQSIVSSSELLGSPQMASIVSEMRKRYSDRYVFFDMPAANESADALTFTPLVDCILIVIEEGKTTFSDVESLIEKFPSEKILGYVANKKR